MDKPTHSVKQAIALKLEQHVYQPAYRKLEARLEAIARANALAGGHNNLGFVYKGEVLAPVAFRPSYGQKAALLSRLLTEQIEQWRADRKEVDQELQLAKNYFACLVIEAKDEAELLALTPDFLRKALGDIASYPKPTLLTQEQVDTFNQRNAAAIQKIKERLVLNLVDA